MILIAYVFPFKGVSRELEQSVTKTFVGTNAYMAPERIQHQPYNERSEVCLLPHFFFELIISFDPPFFFNFFF